MSASTLQAEIAEANRRGCYWLGRMATLERRGIRMGPDREEAERKTQFWLHRFGTLAEQVGA